MNAKLVMTTPLGTKVDDVRFKCSVCGKEYRYVPAYGSSSIRAAASYLKTRFAKHVERHHSMVGVRGASKNRVAQRRPRYEVVVMLPPMKFHL